MSEKSEDICRHAALIAPTRHADIYEWRLRDAIRFRRAHYDEKYRREYASADAGLRHTEVD